MPTADRDGGASPAREQLAVELRARRHSGGNRTYADIVRRAKRSKPSLTLSTSSIGDWLAGKSVPDPPGKFAVFVRAMTDKEPDQGLRNLYRRAQQEGRGVARGRVRATPPTITPTHIPLLEALHYVDVDRLYDLVLSQGGDATVTDLSWDVRRGPGQVMFRRALVNQLDRIAFRAKRFVPDLKLRELSNGDLLIFDTQIRTRNGASPGQRVHLTGNLNDDPHVYIQRRGVRIVLPLKPEMITTDTAYGYFNGGTTQVAGVCRIKYRVAADDSKLLPPTSKVQYLGTPLVLGTADAFHAHADLRQTMIVEAADLESDSTYAIGPWSDLGDHPADEATNSEE